MRPTFASLCTVLVTLLLVGCQTNRPINEYNLARTALNSAEKAKAQQNAPAYWSRAERAYLQGQKEFKEENFKAARQSFLKAKLFAERAENSSVIKTMKEGGSR